MPSIKKFVVQLPVPLTQAQDTTIKIYAEMAGVSRAKIVRDAVDMYLAARAQNESPVLSEEREKEHERIIKEKFDRAQNQ